MLSRSDTPIEEAVQAFAEFGVEAAYLVPTRTILEKNYFDAHQGVREFLAAKGIHDYSTQAQGQDAKRTVVAELVNVDGFETRPLSLYRPSTKQGDPRIWPSRLKTYASEGNLLALVADASGTLYIVNCSDPALMATRNVAHSPLHELLTRRQRGGAADELLGKLRTISAMGFVDTMRPGDTGVGFTLETLLGIKANSLKAPDYKGIEIKSRRTSGKKSTGRSTLFAKTPDWSKSRLKSSREILDEFGYRNENGRLQVYCTIHSRPNPLGIFAVALEEEGLLVHRANGGGEGESVKVVQWSLDVLRESLKAKHHETFWVEAKSRGKGGDEAFHYVRVVHTRSPMTANLAALINSGRLTTDYAIKCEAERVSDKGYLFRMNSEDRHLLFPAPRVYDLVAPAED